VAKTEGKVTYWGVDWEIVVDVGENDLSADRVTIKGHAADAVSAAHDAAAARTALLENK
jgi:hypothetical protein